MPRAPQTRPATELGPPRWRWLLKKETWGAALGLVSGITALALLSLLGGVVGGAIAGFWRRFFGWGVYPLVIIGLAASVRLLGGERAARWLYLRPVQVLGLELALLGCLGLLHLPYDAWNGLARAQAGDGGGLVGWGLVNILERAGGRLPAGLILFAAAVVGAALFFGITRALIRTAGEQFIAVVARRPLPGTGSEYREGPAPLRDEGPGTPPARPAWLDEEPPAPQTAATPVRREPPALPAKRPAAPAPPPAPRWRPPRSASLPSVELLAPAISSAADDADVRYQRQTIEETLAHFGVPAQVVEVQRGPTVTQFGVEPGFVERQTAGGTVLRRKVRVNRIAALSNDLALALAAPSIRIEAPVPGRALVGIEVPNRHTTMVNLRSVLESDGFRRVQSPLRIALGQDVSGRPVAADLAAMPHLLIAGATGTGKSVCINALITCLLMGNTPEMVKLVLVDPKRVELVNYNGIPHLLAPAVVEIEQTVAMLRWLCREMDRRYQEFAQAKVRHIEGYNALAGRRKAERLPYLAVFVDELAELMMVAPDEVERSLCRLAQMGRATGIHLVVATQRPSVDVVTGLIKANFPARIAFAVSTQIDSRVILDTAGAEQLLGRGDLLYMSSDANRLVRLQGCFVSDAEIGAVVDHWRQVAPAESEATTAVPWEALLDEEEGGSDEALLRQAMEIVRGAHQASASFLQRRLRIGYARAARLIEELEARGIVGPDPGGGRPREVYTPREEPPAGDTI
ncbi:MAG TPA: DNA translocase FtsK [Anaerolineae bacterium]|nr:DNA translocase FtsK [Anaerolineae bacterium]HOQ97246.1 DNA translocase FtsK [Anaerolineae bacterium]